MQYAVFTEQELSRYPIALLVPIIRKDEIHKAYIEPHGLNPDDIMVLTLHQTPDKKKTPAAEMKAYFSEVLTDVLMDMKTEYLLVADADYFKVLTKCTKAEAQLGYAMDCVFGPWKVIYVPNYKTLFYDPDKVSAKIGQGIEALKAHRAGSYADPGNSIIKFAEYPQTDEEIQLWLNQLLEMDKPLSIDIEAFDLKHHKAGIGTITFCWSKHEGIAFPVDYVTFKNATEAPYGHNIPHHARRRMLKEFFTKLNQKAIYHNIAYDAYVLIYQLFMEDILDTEGLLEGLEVMLRNWDDTKLITYLATNSCAGNELGLKIQSQEFSGNYAVDDIKDITRIPLDTLLEYNLFDGLSTWFVHEKHHGTMVADEQEEIYETIFKPATVDIIQMQLTGLPVNMETVLKVEQQLLAIEEAAIDNIRNSRTVQQFTYHLQEEHVAKRNAKLKKKQITLSDPEVADVRFNPNSAPQLQALLFEHLALPVISLTDSKLPSTDGDTIKALQHHTKNADVLTFLKGLEDYKAVNKILTDFIPSFKAAAPGPDGWHYLFGNFNLGGTKSGRLSSSGPNLQNLPANAGMMLSEAMLARFGDDLAKFISKGFLSLGKLIKSCVEAPPGWLFGGLDFNSLEDRISALTTKDPNKLKVYTDGYDGHSLRAYTYFSDQMPDIDPTSVASINSIEHKYKPLRQESKAPTFALTYQGTFKTLMTNCGFDAEKAKLIETRYHEMYQVSDKWVADKLNQACKLGYVTIAFGLRLRTPLMAQTIRGTRKTPFQAEAEGRTAGNAMGQSWCLLNSRAGSEFMGKVHKSEHRLSIRPCAQIHDAGYFLIQDDIKAVQFTNKHLVKAVQWQEHPDIAHDEVKLGGELSIFWPTWASEITIPNGASESEILQVIDQHLNG